MLGKLDEVLQLLPSLLDNPDNWDSLVINRRKPWTYRVFTFLPDGSRICLHRFEPCDKHEAFLHPHPWPAAFVLVDGSYEMSLGRSETRTDKEPKDVAKLVLTKGSRYSMTDVNAWHSVSPLETTHTIMVNGTPWDLDYAHVSIRTTKGKDLEKMPRDELVEHLAKFKAYLKELGY